MAPQQVVSLAYSPDQILKLAESGQLKGQELAVMARNSVVARARAITNQNSPNYELEFNKVVEGLRKEAEAGSQEISKAAAPHMRGLTITRRLAGDMATIEAELQGTGISPNEYLGELRSGIGGPLASKVQNLRIKLNNDQTDSPAQRQSMEFLKASERFHQVLAQKVIEFNHTNIGGAQSPAELDATRQVISTEAGWDKIKNFVNTESQTYAAAYKNALSTATSPYAKMLYWADNGNGLATLGRNGVAAPTRRDPVMMQRGEAAPTKGEATPLANPGSGPTGYRPRQEEFAP